VQQEASDVKVPFDHLLDLRNELYLATQYLAGQLERIEALRETHGHSLALLEEVSPGLPTAERSSCHAYALELLPPYPVGSTGVPLRPSAEFVSHLIDTGGLAPIDDLVASPGDIMVYYEDERDPPLIVHLAVWEGSTARSKWGDGHIWRHALFELPSNYGCRVEFYRRTPDIAARWVAHCNETILAEGSETEE
jgi:hypothetical protein